MVQNNLGTAYSRLRTGERGDHLHQALASYEQALGIWTYDAAPFNYAMAQRNLAAIYGQLFIGDRTFNLQQSIACCKEALRVWTPENAPLDYAITQHHMGMAYQELPTGDLAAHLAQALSCYEEALCFCTPETSPSEYARTQNSLGNIYSRQVTADRTSNLKLKTDPSAYRTANILLADISFKRGQLEDALHAYHAAMDAGELLYRSGMSAESKGVAVIQNTVLYRHAAFASVRSGKIREALLILERGKTRLLAEAMHLRPSRPSHVPDDIWQTFEHASGSVRALQQGEITTFNLDDTSNPVRFYAAREQGALVANATLNAAIEKVRLSDPEFLREMDFSTIQHLLPDEQPHCVRRNTGFVISMLKLLPYMQQNGIVRPSGKTKTNRGSTRGWNIIAASLIKDLCNAFSPILITGPHLRSMGYST